MHKSDNCALSWLLSRSHFRLFTATVDAQRKQLLAAVGCNVDRGLWCRYWVFALFSNNANQCRSQTLATTNDSRAECKAKGAQQIER